jgi:hypothetical protein
MSCTLCNANFPLLPFRGRVYLSDFPLFHRIQFQSFPRFCFTLFIMSLSIVVLQLNYSAWETSAFYPSPLVDDFTLSSIIWILDSFSRALCQQALVVDILHRTRRAWDGKWKDLSGWQAALTFKNLLLSPPSPQHVVWLIPSKCSKDFAAENPFAECLNLYALLEVFFDFLLVKRYTRTT